MKLTCLALPRYGPGYYRPAMHRPGRLAAGVIVTAGAIATAPSPIPIYTATNPAIDRMSLIKAPRGRFFVGAHPVHGICVDSVDETAPDRYRVQHGGPRASPGRSAMRPMRMTGRPNLTRGSGGLSSSAIRKSAAHSDIVDREACLGARAASGHLPWQNLAGRARRSVHHPF